MSVASLFIIFAILIVIAVPIGMILAILGILPNLIDPWFPADPQYIIRAMINGVDSFPLLAVPMFVLSGNIMAEGKISKKLFNFFSYFVADKTAGLPIATVITCLFYGAISGSGPATTAAVGAMTIPIMVNLGYDKVFSTSPSSKPCTSAWPPWPAPAKTTKKPCLTCCAAPTTPKSSAPSRATWKARSPSNKSPTTSPPWPMPPCAWPSSGAGRATANATAASPRWASSATASSAAKSWATAATSTLFSSLTTATPPPPTSIQALLASSSPGSPPAPAKATSLKSTPPCDPTATAACSSPASPPTPATSSNAAATPPGPGNIRP